MFLLLILLSSCGPVAQSLFGPRDPDHGVAVRFTVKKGESASILGSRLEKEGVISSSSRWRLYLRWSREGGCVKAGDFALRSDMPMSEIIGTLCGTPLPEDIPFTVVEGWRIAEIDAALAQAGLARPGAYTFAVADPKSYQVKFPFEGSSLEGYLFPETYMVVPARFDLHTFVQRQLDAFQDQFHARHAKDLGQRKLLDVVIMASMVEREEPDPKMRPKVAGVLWKRLDSGWNLGVDATSRYTLADWNDRKAFLVKLRDPRDPYNTRLRQGLPPGPIGNPGIVALEAALEPVTSDAWYYLHDSSRVVHFGRNESEHEANRRRFGVW